MLRLRGAPCSSREQPRRLFGACGPTPERERMPARCDLVATQPFVRLAWAQAMLTPPKIDPHAAVGRGAPRGHWGGEGAAQASKPRPVKVLALKEERWGGAPAPATRLERRWPKCWLKNRSPAARSESRPRACATIRGVRDQVAVTSTPARRKAIAGRVSLQSEAARRRSWSASVGVQRRDKDRVGAPSAWAGQRSWRPGMPT